MNPIERDTDRHNPEEWDSGIDCNFSVWDPWVADVDLGKENKDQWLNVSFSKKFSIPCFGKGHSIKY